MTNSTFSMIISTCHHSHTTGLISGSQPSQLADAREGFESNKYNILVSTSMSEEGIDIRACNLVVRYMYVKDAISRIQAKGTYLIGYRSYADV